MLSVAREIEYICPGEIHPISRAVHLSRLAAFYPACRECPFRTDVGQLPRQAVERIQQTERRVERKSLFTTEGVRGVWLNELMRVRAGEMATAFASALWDAAPVAVRSDDECAGSRRLRPSVVVGHDERPSSPDIVTGVAGALRRMGCQVIDVGLSTRPCLWFAVEHLHAAGGMHVTGSGCEPSWTGLDFVGRRGMPLSKDDSERFSTDSGDAPAEWIDLREIEKRTTLPASRPTRQAVPHRTFQASIPYEAGFWKHFHALRPLHVICGSGSKLAEQTLERIFASLPCRISFVSLPDRVRRLEEDRDPDVVHLGEAVTTARADLGILIDDDGQRCTLFDERGRRVPHAALARLLGGLALSESPRGTIVAAESLCQELTSVAARFGGQCRRASETVSGIARAMHASQGVFGADAASRCWFRENVPTSDAILTLAKTLSLLSRSDLDFSDVANAP